MSKRKVLPFFWQNNRSVKWISLQNFFGFFPGALLFLVTGGFVLAEKEIARQPKVIMGDPVVVAQGPVGEQRWGFWQFPTIERLADGRILAGWHVAPDSARDYGSPHRAYAISSDTGKSWQRIEKAEVDGFARGKLLGNGDRLYLGWETYQKSLPLETLELPEPVGTWTYNYDNQPFKFYLPETLSEEARKGWPQIRSAKGVAAGAMEYPEVKIPGVIQPAREGVLVRPFFMGNFLVAPNGHLWTSCYWNRHLDGKISNHLPTFVRSVNHGRTWEFVSDIPYQPDKTQDAKWDKRDGFTEPELAVMPDGSMLTLLRVTDGNGPGPSYIARSTDNGKTWGKPEVFDKIGVLPQLLVLKNGITLASYGRPGVFVRATADKSGLTWGEPVAIALRKTDVREWSGTCAYTHLLELSNNTALLVYSDFEYPDNEGKPCKTIMVRTITVSRE